MADSPAEVQNPSEAPKTPFAQKLIEGLQKTAKALLSLLSVPVVAALGFGIIILTWLGVLAQKHFSHISDVAGPIAQHVSSWPFLLTGIGLWLIAKSRAMVRDGYEAAAKKDKNFPHAWKIGLIGTQSFALYLLSFYAIGVGFKIWPKVQSVVLLLLLFLLFLSYLLWYVISHFRNRYPQAFGFRAAFLALVLAILAAFCVSQVILIGLILAFFALITALVSISSVPFSAPERGVWIRALCLMGTVGLLLPTAYNFFFSKDTACNLVELNSAVKGLSGDVFELCYSPDGKQLAFSVKKDQWYLEMFTPGDHKNPMVKFPAGEDAFTPLFVNNGKALLSDATNGGARNLRLTNLANGTQTALTENGVEPLSDGVPYSPSLSQVVFVSQDQDAYALQTLSLGKKTRVKNLLQSNEPLSSPSWSYDSKTIVYLAGTGVDSSIHVYTLAGRKDHKVLLLGENHEDPAIPADQKPQKFSLLKVIPAPDGFRYLYLTQEGKRFGLWTIHPDGSKESLLYETNNPIGKILWTPDAQKIIFVEQPSRFGLSGGLKNVKILDANLSTVESLLLPQISDWDPAVTPDGANVAFVCGENLWYPSMNRLGIWIGTLR